MDGLSQFQCPDFASFRNSKGRRGDGAVYHPIRVFQKTKKKKTGHLYTTPPELQTAGSPENGGPLAKGDAKFFEITRFPRFN